MENLEFPDGETRVVFHANISERQNSMSFVCEDVAHVGAVVDLHFLAIETDLTSRNCDFCSCSHNTLPRGV